MRTRKRAFRIAFFALLIALAGMVVWVDSNLKPIVLQMAEARIQAEGGRALNEAVMDNIVNGVTYSDLVTVYTDDVGNVTRLDTNTQAMTKLSTQTAISAQDRIARIGVQGISVPLGTAIGSQLLAGKGPPIRIQIVPVGSVRPEFVSEMKSAGINQTRHRIFLKLFASMRIVLPAGSRTVEVVTQVPIAETIIVGKVPNTFVITENGADMLNLVPGQ